MRPMLQYLLWAAYALTLLLLGAAAQRIRAGLRAAEAEWAAQGHGDRSVDLG